MSWLSVIAFVTGALGVFLTIRQTIWCWPVALIAVVVSIAEFYNERLYGDMALQVFYFFAGVYGWIFWKQKQSQEFKVHNTPVSLFIPLLAATILQSVVYYFILTRLSGDKPLFDAVLTASSLTTTYMMTRKWIENWIIWVIVDLAYTVLYLQKQMWLFAALYMLFAFIAYYGWINWRKQSHLKLA